MSNISEEQRLKMALAESEKRLREALAAAGEGAWRINLDSRLLEISEVIAGMMNLPAENTRVTLADWTERVHPDDRAGIHEGVASLAAGERDVVDRVVRFNDASKGWVRLHLRGRVSEYDDHRHPLAATGFVTDVSERFQIQEKLAIREQQLTEAVDAASLGTWRVDITRKRVILRGSIVAEMLADDTEAEVSVADWVSRVHPDDAAEVRRVNLGVLRGAGETSEVTCRMRTRRDEWRWYRVTGRVVDRDADGHPLASSGVMWDVDAARRFDDTLQAQRQRFERIYRATPGMMHTIDAEGRIVEVSDYWLEYLGYERQEVLGRRSIDFLDPESRQRALDVSLPELFERGRNTNMPYRFLHKDGHAIEVLLSSFLERDGEGKPLFSYAVMTDVTALHRVNEQLERTNQQLDRFATIASHDLQEPLRKISAFAGLVQRRYADKLDADGVRSLEFLVDAAHRMQRLVEDLLAYSKLANQTLHVSRLNTAEILADVCEILDSPISESGAEVTGTDLPVIEADRTLFTQALQNLVSNAVKYRDQATPRIGVSARRTEDNWEFAVRDNGIGFDMRFAEKIFNPFERLHTREAFRGTGIGLAIVRQSVERQGGRVWVESSPGQGSTFHFTIPLTLRASEAEHD